MYTHNAVPFCPERSSFYLNIVYHLSLLLLHLPADTTSGPPNVTRRAFT